MPPPPPFPPLHPSPPLTLLLFAICFDSLRFWFRLALLRCGSQRFRLACCCVSKSLSIPFLSFAFLFHFHFPFCSSQFATFASDRSCLSLSLGLSFCRRRAVAKCSFPLCGAMPQRVARSFRCCKHLERCREKGKGGSRVAPPPLPVAHCVARQKFKVQSEYFRFSPLINVSKLAPQLHLPLATWHLPQQPRLRLLAQLLPHPAWPGVEFIDSQSTPAAFDLFASSIHFLWQPAPPPLPDPTLPFLLPLLLLNFHHFHPILSGLFGGRVQFNKQHLIKFKSIRLPRSTSRRTQTSFQPVGKSRGKLSEKLAI